MAFHGWQIVNLVCLPLLACATLLAWIGQRRLLANY
jgi:hypothetical protein